MGVLRGFIVHAYAERRKNRILSAGRLEDGRSFAIADSRFVPSLLVNTARSALPPSCRCSVETSPLVSFEDSSPLLSLRFANMTDREDAVTALRAAGIPSPDSDTKPAVAYLLERGIRGPIVIDGVSRPGRGVDLVFSDPVLSPADPSFRAPLRIASIDIETNVATGSIRAVAVATSGLSGQDASSSVFYRGSEADILRETADAVAAADPDVLTGWNFLDFDFPRLAERFDALSLPFTLGRSTESARFMAGEGRRSSAAFVPGRQVMDALRAVRAGPERFPDYRLETVARAVLGEGKSLAFDDGAGAEKIAMLDSLYESDRDAFAEYCRNDAVLVLRIMEKTGLFRLAVERAALTGVSLDKAWTSVASFERVYAAELRTRNIAPVRNDPGRTVSGAAGGTVLDPETGLFRNIAIFDFRSLYPTIIRTFNIDPLSNRRALGNDADIVAPNHARFAREAGILPDLIADYFASRRAAIASGDEVGSFVYKILMNSFYGVLGSGTCRYARTELAGAITSFARKWLHFSRDWFVARGMRVLYGDTDSLFVETALTDGTSYAEFSEVCGNYAARLNAELSERIRAEYSLESFLEIRFEKAYRRFLIPPLRAIAEDGISRGRAKGYAGVLLAPEGSTSIEVKGMEAVRSDVTALARESQLELLALAFADQGPQSIRDYLVRTEKLLRSGAL
ncbi:MAG: DNA polymerase domain-containing protein, partial [Treponemataceae bacterium]